MKTILATVGAVMTAVTLGAAEAEAEVSESEEEENGGLGWLEAGFDLDFTSAYIWRNIVQSDEMVMQPCVWADVSPFEFPAKFGFYVWQSYDLTDNRRSDFRHALSEIDYNVHFGLCAYEGDAGKLELEFGHEWFTYPGHRSDVRTFFCDTREVYAKATYGTSFVDVYGQASWMYKDFGDYKSSLHYELGLKREFELVKDTLSLGADWNVNFGDSNYLYFLLGGRNYDERDDGTETWKNPTEGFAGTTVKAYLTWSITEWMSLTGTIAYTGLLNPSMRDEIASDPENDYDRDLLWGGLKLSIAF